MQRSFLCALLFQIVSADEVNTTNFFDNLSKARLEFSKKDIKIQIQAQCYDMTWGSHTGYYIQTTHPYNNNYNYQWCRLGCYHCIAYRFYFDSQCYTEPDYDYFEIYDGSNSVSLYKSSGNFFDTTIYR